MFNVMNLSKNKVSAVKKINLKLEQYKTEDAQIFITGANIFRYNAAVNSFICFYLN